MWKILILCQLLCWCYTGNFVIWAWHILLPSPLHITIWFCTADIKAIFPVSKCPQLSSILLVYADVLPSVWHTLCFLPISLTSACFYSYSLENIYLLSYMWLRCCALNTLSISLTSPVISFLKQYGNFLFLMDCQFREGRDYNVFHGRLPNTDGFPAPGTCLVLNKKYCRVHKYWTFTRSKPLYQAVWEYEKLTRPSGRELTVWWADWTCTYKL